MCIFSPWCHVCNVFLFRLLPHKTVCISQQITWYWTCRMRPSPGKGAGCLGLSAPYLGSCSPFWSSLRNFLWEDPDVRGYSQVGSSLAYCGNGDFCLISSIYCWFFFLSHPPPLTASADTEEGKALHVLILLLVLEPESCCFLVPGMFLAWAILAPASLFQSPLQVPFVMWNLKLSLQGTTQTCIHGVCSNWGSMCAS